MKIYLILVDIIYLSRKKRLPFKRIIRIYLWAFT